MTTQFACSSFVTRAELAAAPCACNWDEVDDADLLDAVIDQSSDILTIISGMRIHGLCTETVRPVGDTFCIPWGLRCDYPVGYGTTYPSPISPWLYGTVRLRTPRPDVVEIRINGSILPASSYGLIDDEWLQRRDGSPWPSVNDLTKPDTAAGTWSIKYRYGRVPDFITKEACIELSCELMAGYMGKTTHLPAGVISANIQGAQVNLQDRAEALRETADEQIPAISRFIGVYAPDGQARSGVWSPELAGQWNLIQVEGPSGS